MTLQSKDRADQLAALISEYEPLLKYGVMSSERSLKEVSFFSHYFLKSIFCLKHLRALL